MKLKTKIIKTPIWVVTKVEYEDTFVVAINSHLFESESLADEYITLVQKSNPNFGIKSDEYEKDLFIGTNKYSSDEWIRITKQIQKEIVVAQEDVENKHLQKILKSIKGSYINNHDELIIDAHYNIYTNIKSLKNSDDWEDYRMMLIYATCRPIGKSMVKADAEKLLSVINTLTGYKLTTKDMYNIYGNANSWSGFKEFMKEGNYA